MSFELLLEGLTDIPDIPDLSDVADVPDIADVEAPIDRSFCFDAGLKDSADPKAVDITQSRPDTVTESRSAGELKKVFSLFIRAHKLQLILIAVGLIMVVVYQILIHSGDAARSVYFYVIRPLHSALASLNDHTSLCVGEVIIAAAIIALIVYALLRLVDKIYPFRRMMIRFSQWFVLFPIRYKVKQKRNPIAELTGLHKMKRTQVIWSTCSALLTVIMLVSLVYGGFCMLWGFYYAAPGVSEIFGFDTDGVEHDDLVAVDRAFVNLANEYSALTARGEDGSDTAAVYSDARMEEWIEHADAGTFVFSDSSFAHSIALYDAVSLRYPGLSDKPHIPKKVHFSRIVSMLDFTGFFFPFTAEACINMDSPDSMRPATIAHELAHQRGIASEDEANFVGILASLEDGDPDYVYSASLMALIHLQNALYESGDIDTWQEIKDSYSPLVAADLRENNEYWSKYRKNPVNKVSTNTYDAFLKSYDQPLGRETYGACVDYLVCYFSIVENCDIFID
ncbi:MAG: DUF3810 domain-containing protein [Lachnospiraceae bacterium]|nr:DUF3810 domain-containing protein [Lachnospiraceae bacterium]